MSSYKIKLPRGLEVDIFQLPENFDEEINRVFGEYTQETAEDYRDCDRLGFIDCCVRHINGDKDRYDVVDEKIKDFITYQWEKNMVNLITKMMCTALISWQTVMQRVCRID